MFKSILENLRVFFVLMVNMFNVKYKIGDKYKDEYKWWLKFDELNNMFLYIM